MIINNNTLTIINFLENSFKLNDELKKELYNKINSLENSRKASLKNT